MDNLDDATANPKDLVHVRDFTYDSSSPMRTQVARSAVVALLANQNSIDCTKSTQPVLEVIKELPVDQAVSKVVPKAPALDTDIALLAQDNDYNRD